MDILNTRLRTITWGDYEISADRYKELQYFCRQYSEKKKTARRHGEYSIAVSRFDRASDHSSGRSPTELAAIRNVAKAERALKDCRIIEEAAMWAAGVCGYNEVWKALLRNVTEGTGYDILIGQYNIPFCVADFYGLRRAFFYRLDRLQHDEVDDDGDDVDGRRGVEDNRRS